MLCNVSSNNNMTGSSLVGKKIERSPKLLSLAVVVKKIPWDVLFLLGGGYAIANGCEVLLLSNNHPFVANVAKQREHQVPERHVLCLVHHYFTDARKISWFYLG